MSGKKKTSEFIYNAAIFILLEVAALGMLRHCGTLQDMWISRGLHAFYASVWGKSEDIRYYFSLRKENDRLAEENFRLSQEARYYRDLLGLKDHPSPEETDTLGHFTYIPAEIVKISNNSQHNYIVIGKGSEDGILPQSGIITEQGVIGIVDAVSRHYSYAISFRNAEITVSARIGRKGPVGSLAWDGHSGSGAILSEIPLHIGFAEGDTVFTSGFSSIFPPDIPLGTVGESRIINGATFEIEIGLFEDFKSLRYVMVAHNTGKEEIRELVSAQK